MLEFRALLDRFWITRSEDKELYYQVKRAQPKFRRFVNELLGWNLIVNEAVVKLEKVPPKAMAWMGIQDFQEPLDYCLLCALLLYLSDRDDGEEFLLSNLTESVQAFMAEVSPVDWTRFSHRKALVRILRYAQETGLLLVYDGSSEGFGNDRNQEVLYENTGLSRHFVVHFGRSILDCASIEDFEALAREGEDPSGRLRLHRIYQQLSLSPALYRSDQNRNDYDYLKNQHKRIEANLRTVLNGELHLHKNGAFFVLEDGSRVGEVHPGGRDLSDVVLLLCGRLREAISQGRYAIDQDDMVWMSRMEFTRELQLCRDQSKAGWGRGLRELPLEKLCQDVIRYMSGWMLLEDCSDNFLLYPAAGKWIGHYPPSWRQEAEEEDSDEPMEDA